MRTLLLFLQRRLNQFYLNSLFVVSVEVDVKHESANEKQTVIYIFCHKEKRSISTCVNK